MKTYMQILGEAIDMMMALPDIEPRSALKQCASDAGIPYGDDMLTFVTWAEQRLYDKVAA